MQHDTLARLEPGSYLGFEPVLLADVHLAQLGAPVPLDEHGQRSPCRNSADSGRAARLPLPQHDARLDR